MLVSSFFLVISYLIGSVSFAIIVSKIFGLNDPRNYGSKNPGATNVLRSGKKIAALLTLLGDSLKGYFVVSLALKFLPNDNYNELLVALMRLCAFLGHIFPVFYKFKGGKGVATAAGILFAINFYLGIFTILTWLAVAIFTRYSSLSALIASIVAPLICWYMCGDIIDSPFTAVVIIMAVILIYKHKDNLKRLFSGEETKIKI